MTESLEPLKEFLIDFVVPERRENVNINVDHHTTLLGQKSKKQVSRKQKNRKSKISLTRRQYANLGLYTLPTKQMRYEELLPLHRLWKGYMREHLNLQEGDTVPEVHDRRYDAFSKLLIKTDLHGAKLRVIESSCPTLINLSGIVVMETKNVLKLLGEDDKLRTVPKKECNFVMQLGNMEFTIFGKSFRIRPAERAVKRIKGFIET